MLVGLRRMASHMIDIGANLTDDMFQGIYNGTVRHHSDMDAVLFRAREAGVTRIMVTAGTLTQSHEALELVRGHPMLVSTVGVHPTRCNELQGDMDHHLDQLSDVITRGNGKVVAVGECGLDYDRTQFCDIETQQRGYEAQFKLAERHSLPMFLHNRNTGDDFVTITKRNRARFSTGVVHSFTGSMEEMESLVAMDLFIGINGCSLKTEDNLRVAAAVPSDRLMIETDSPYCEIRSTHAGYSKVRSRWPAKDKKKFEEGSCVKGRCEPCYLRQVLEVLSAVRGQSEEELCRSTFNNTVKVFFPTEAVNMGPSPYDWSRDATN